MIRTCSLKQLKSFFLTCSLNQSINEISQFVPNLTDAQNAPLVSHGIRQSCSPVQRNPFAAYHRRWLT